MEDLLYRNDAFPSEGLCYNLSNVNEIHPLKLLLDDANRCVNYVNNSLQSAPRIEIFFLNNPRLGAVAKKYRDAYCIGIYDGSFAVFQTLFDRMLTSPNVLSYYGNSASEQVKKTNAPFIVNGAFALDNEQDRPRDEDRKTMARFLTFIALRYLVLHENAHIIHGHCGLLDAINRGENLKETIADLLDFSSITPVMYQALEYDADVTASNSLLRYHMAIAAGETPELRAFSVFYDTTNYPSRFFQLLNKEGNPICFEQIFIPQVFALATTFRVFGIRESNMDTLKFGTHSPPSIRLLQLYTALLFHASKLVNNWTPKHLELELYEPVRQAMLFASREVQKAFIEISEDIDYFETEKEIILNFHKKSFEHLGVQRDAWKDVRPLIEPYAYALLAPIDERDWHST